MDEGRDSTNVVIEVFGEGEGFPNKSRAALPQGVIEAPLVIGLPRLLADLIEGISVEDGSVGFPVVGVGLSTEVALRQGPAIRLRLLLHPWSRHNNQRFHV